MTGLARTGMVLALILGTSAVRPPPLPGQETTPGPALRPSAGTILKGGAAGGLIVAAGGAAVGLALTGGDADGWAGAGVGILAAAGWAIGAPLGARISMQRGGYEVGPGALLAVSVASVAAGALGILAVHQGEDSSDARWNLDDPRYWHCVEDPNGSTLCSPLWDDHGPSDWAYVAAGLGAHVVTFVVLGRFTGSKPAAERVAVYPSMGRGRAGFAVRITVR